MSQWCLNKNKNPPEAYLTSKTDNYFSIIEIYFI